MITNILIWIFVGAAIFFVLAGIAVQIYLFIILPAIEERRQAKCSKEVARLLAERLAEIELAKEKENK